MVYEYSRNEVSVLLYIEASVFLTDVNSDDNRNDNTKGIKITLTLHGKVGGGVRETCFNVNQIAKLQSISCVFRSPEE